MYSYQGPQQQYVSWLWPWHGEAVTAFFFYGGLWWQCACWKIKDESYKYLSKYETIRKGRELPFNLLMLIMVQQRRLRPRSHRMSKWSWEQGQWNSLVAKCCMFCETLWTRGQLFITTASFTSASPLYCQHVCMKGEVLLTFCHWQLISWRYKTKNNYPIALVQCS